MYEIPPECNKDWIAWDLDGTLAKYVPGEYRTKGPLHIGEPILAAVALVKQQLSNGYRVKIFTARAYEPELGVVEAIKSWCLEHVGQELEVTCVKDYNMSCLFDDRAFRVKRNTGEVCRCE